MKKIFLIVATLLLTAGCAVVSRPDSATLYDLGPVYKPSSVALPVVPALSVAEVSIPAWLDSTMMFYRLRYVNELQPHPYAHARWSMTPAQLLSQHLKSRIVQAGGVALETSAGTVDVPVLRVAIDDFTQNFDSPGQSSAQLGLRASVFRGRMLIAQKAFVRQAPAPSPDANGGAKALAMASDAVIGDLIGWLAGLPLK